jgi:hypothetical protein
LYLHAGGPTHLYDLLKPVATRATFAVVATPHGPGLNVISWHSHGGDVKLAAEHVTENESTSDATGGTRDSKNLSRGDKIRAHR